MNDSSELEIIFSNPKSIVDTLGKKGWEESETHGRRRKEIFNEDQSKKFVFEVTNVDLAPFMLSISLLYKSSENGWFQVFSCTQAEEIRGINGHYSFTVEAVPEDKAPAQEGASRFCSYEEDGIRTFICESPPFTLDQNVIDARQFRREKGLYPLEEQYVPEKANTKATIRGFLLQVLSGDFRRPNIVPILPIASAPNVQSEKQE